MYDAICSDLEIPMKRIGSLYVTFHEEGDEEMMKKYQRGLENGTRVWKFCPERKRGEWNLC